VPMMIMLFILIPLKVEVSFVTHYLFQMFSYWFCNSKNCIQNCKHFTLSHSNNSCKMEIL